MYGQENQAFLASISNWQAHLEPDVQLQGGVELLAVAQVLQRNNCL